MKSRNTSSRNPKVVFSRAERKKIDQEKDKFLLVMMVREKCCTQEIAIMRSGYRTEAISILHLGDCFTKPGTCWHHLLPMPVIFPASDAFNYEGASLSI